MMNLKYLFKTAFLFLCLSLMIGCSDDEDDLDPEGNEEQTFETQVFLTDSPIDNAEVEAVFVTVTEVWINGQAIEGFEKTSIEISSLHSGNTQLLGDLDLESGTTSDITLVLDNETDASGSTPGNYVLTSNGEKKALTSSNAEISLSDTVDIQENNDNEVILDFDLRKAIVNDDNGNYSFVSDNKLAGSIRAVNTLETGIISGAVSNFGTSTSDAMVVYAYSVDSYGDTETSADADGSRFSNAVNSAIINESSGEFELHFMEEGDYELHFISYTDNDADGKLEFEGELEATSTNDVDINLLDISVNAEAQVDIEVIIVGLLAL